MWKWLKADDRRIVASQWSTFRSMQPTHKSSLSLHQQPVPYLSIRRKAPWIAYGSYITNLARAGTAHRICHWQRGEAAGPASGAWPGPNLGCRIPGTRARRCRARTIRTQETKCQPLCRKAAHIQPERGGEVFVLHRHWGLDVDGRGLRYTVYFRCKRHSNSLTVVYFSYSYNECLL